MSVEAVKWAISDAPPVKNDAAGRVLFYLAEAAHKDGRNAFPSRETIAYELWGEYTDATRKKVTRAFQYLTDGGWITEDFGCNHPKYVGFRGDRRPKAWRLNLSFIRPVSQRPPRKRKPAETRGDANHPPKSTGGEICPQRGVKSVQHEGTQMTPKPLEEPPVEPRERGDMFEDTSPTPSLADSLYESFPDHCHKHRHTPPAETGPCGGCKAQREANEREAHQKQDDQTAREARRIAGIPHCDYCTDDGTHPYIKRSSTGGLFEHFKKCNHSDQDRQELDEVLAFRERHGDAA